MTKAASINNVPKPPDTPIFLVRPDRIGDTVLTTAAFQLVHDFFVEWSTRFDPSQTYNPPIVLVLNPVVAPLFLKHTFSDDQQSTPIKTLTTDTLLTAASELQKPNPPKSSQAHFDFNRGVALFFQYNRRLVQTFRRKQVFCFGPYSKLSSYFFLHRGVRQSRSRSLVNEAEYNLQLAKAFLKRLTIRAGMSESASQSILEAVTSRKQYVSRLCVSLDERNAARQFIERELQRADPTARLSHKGFILCHPGMRGSALNISNDIYIEILKKLSVHSQKAVLITGGVDDVEVVQKISREAQVPSYLFSSIELRRYAALIAEASCLIAPSTGPLHVAAAVGTRTVSFFSPVLVQSPTRWSPVRPDAPEQHRIFVPQVKCPEKFHCAGNVCREFRCIDRMFYQSGSNKLSVDEVVEAVLQLSLR